MAGRQKDIGVTRARRKRIHRSSVSKITRPCSRTRCKINCPTVKGRRGLRGAAQHRPLVRWVFRPCRDGAGCVYWVCIGKGDGIGGLDSSRTFNVLGVVTPCIMFLNSLPNDLVPAWTMGWQIIQRPDRQPLPPSTYEATFRK